MVPKLIPLRALVFGLVLTACATPVDNGPVIDAVMVEAGADPNPYTADQTLTDLLSRTDLTDDQRARALYARGSLRRQSGDDRHGAVKDLEAMLALAPNHPLAENAREELAFAQKDVETIEASLQRMLTLSQWFDNMWVLGEHDAAAARYRASGLSPDAAQIAKLVAAGYVCHDAEDAAPVYMLGDMRPDLENIHWCTGADA